MGGAAVAALLLRAPRAPRQIWAEDGSVFLEDAIGQGRLHSFFDAYQGYYHLVPRAIGAIAASLPLADASVTTWLLVALVVGFCATCVFLFSEPWITWLPSRALLALSLVILPVLRVESIANAATLQFTMVFASLVVLVGSSPARSRSGRVAGCALLVSTGLTTPIAALLAPFALLQLAHRPAEGARWKAASWAVGVAIQWSAIVVVRPERDLDQSAPFRRVVGSYVTDAVSQTFSPSGRWVSPIGVVLSLGFVCLAVASVAMAWRRGDRRRACLIVLVPLAGLGMFALLSLRSGVYARYESLPAWCLIWFVLVAAEVVVEARTWEPVAWRHRVAGALVVVGALVIPASVRSWSPAPHRSSGPLWEDSLSAAEASCSSGDAPYVEAGISPLPETSRRWSVRLPCETLR